jgi:molybdopterin/thiamine biosynthesis adenylyltransferase
LLIGVGGLGSGVAMGLARLGVRKIILIDNGTVDESNLNRQLLFMHDDIDKEKTIQGKMRIEMAHKVRKDMEIEAYTLDVLTEWPKVSEIMQRTGEEAISVVFNMVDVGEYFDFAVQSICMA